MQTTEENVKEEKQSLTARINSQLNKENVFKDLGNIQLSQITLLADLSKQVLASEKKEEALPILEGYLAENPHSLVARYILGSIDVQENKKDSFSYLTSVLNDFVTISKWTIVDHIADLLLNVQENNRIALRAKVESVANLKGKKEMRPFLEKLAKIDRKNPSVSKRYALSILEDDPKTALRFLKQAGETYARLKNYKSLEDIWMLVIQHDAQDLSFFERIERILIGDRQKIWLASHLNYLLEPFKREENWDKVIHVLKKILHYEPYSSRARSDLVRVYRSKYENHSLVTEFLKLSELTNHKRTVEPCIANFERNIVFDVDNYVYHSSRGVGKITSIDNQQVIIDFFENPGQRMSIQMAIHSLQPLEADHIWASHYENSKEIEELFQNDTILFLETLLSSFKNRMTTGEIKAELSSRLLKKEEWSKWWTHARNKIKKDSRFGFNPNKKDELILRDIPMTLTEELSAQFQSELDWNKKIDIAYATLKDSDTEGATLIVSQFYEANQKNKDTLKCIHSYFFLEHAKEAMGEEISTRQLKQEEVERLIQEASPTEIANWSKNTQQVEFKKDLVDLIIKNREDYPEVLKLLLFEVPVKNHRYIFTELIRLQKEDVLAEYLEELFRKYREYPEIFLWAARSILSNQWESYKWVKASTDNVILLVFRILKPLHNIEKKGVKLKNAAIDIICGTSNITVDALKKHELLTTIIKEADAKFLQRIHALFRDVPYIPDAHKENMQDFMKALRSDLDFLNKEEEFGQEEENTLFPANNTILSSEKALAKRREYLDHLIHIEMPANSRDIGEAQEKGDLRENAEYKAAMEKQSQLQAEILTISNELQRARTIRPRDVSTDLVSIGTTVKVLNTDKKEEEFTILGPWDADTDRKIISYASPLAKVLIGKKPEEKASLDKEKVYTIKDIKVASI